MVERRLHDIYKFKVSKFMYTFHNNSLPEIFESYFLPLKQAHTVIITPEVKLNKIIF